MYSMTMELRTGDAECLYEQIYKYIKNEIQKGKLLAGEKLPSTRSLATCLQVARSTVEYAYGQLLDEGYIESRPCKGYFVCEMDAMLKFAGQGEKNPSSEAEEKADSLTKYEFDFSPYDIDLTSFPFSVWKKITKNILTDANSEMFSRGEAQGDIELRTTISRYLHSSRGVNASPEQIVVGAGNDYLLMLLEKLLDKNLHIAMENPTYLRPFRIFQSFSYEILTVNMDESGMKVNELEDRDVDAVYVMPSHQFPSGVVMPIGRRLELLNWAGREEGRYIIEDDYDSEFRYHGKPIPALLASDQKDRVIYIGSFSKSIAPAIRISFMVLPKSLLEKFRRECFFYSCTVSRIDQRILNEFIRDGYFERHLNKMRTLYRTKHELLLEQLKDFKGDFVLTGENAGLHLVMTSQRGISEKELVELAASVGIRVYGLSENMSGSVTETNTVLLGFGGLTLQEITEGIRRLKEVWTKEF